MCNFCRFPVSPHQAYKLLGLTYNAMGDKDRATQAYRLAVVADANNSEAFAKLGALLRYLLLLCLSVIFEAGGDAWVYLWHVWCEFLREKA